MDSHYDSGAGAPRANRLSREQSPYLLQHAENPVDWYPWGPEAFERARREDKPIFLSIGYSTCHWCHVMARESFQDPEVARLINEVFVPIKVDREERPEIDQLYMTACQMMTGSGGWPLTLLLTPDRRPFFAGTYLPRTTRFGHIGLLDFIPQVRELWSSRRQEIDEAARQIATSLQGSTTHAPGEELGEAVLEAAFAQLAHQYDAAHGGFGGAPKFPMPHELCFLLRYAQHRSSEDALEMVTATLRAMRRGGIYDQLGNGFHRYATDARWLVPHFEKMLYDQALLAMAYLEGYQATGAADFAQVAREIFAYVARELTGPAGGFYSAQDADSEHVEGKFYLWTTDEIRRLLSPEDAALAEQAFGMHEDGNFRDAKSGARSDANVLHLAQPAAQLAAQLSQSEDHVQHRLEQIRAQLFAYRDRRERPLTDDKILTDWSGLMIAALAQGTRVLGEQSHAEAAARAATFVLAQMRDGSGQLLHRYRGGQAAVPGLLDDYAFLVWGLIELYEATFEAPYLREALELNQQMLVRFWDDSQGGLFTAPAQAEDLLVRQKTALDGALPSGNSIALGNLLRLARLTGLSALEERAHELIRAFARRVVAAPAAFTQFLVGLDFALRPGREIVIAGDPSAPDTQALLAAVRKPFLPNHVVVLRPTNQAAPEICELAAYTREQGTIDGHATAYVCERLRCLRPTTDPAELLGELGVAAAP